MVHMTLEARTQNVRKRLICGAGCLAAGLLTAAGGCGPRQQQAVQPAAVQTAAANPGEKMTQDKFEGFYAQWQEYIKSPRIQLSSNPRTYTDCKPFSDMISLGRPALPLLIAKMKQGDAAGWSESQFFLWHAVKEITGTDLASGGASAIEQQTARLYIDWWEKQPK